MSLLRNLCPLNLCARWHDREHPCRNLPSILTLSLCRMLTGYGLGSRVSDCRRALPAASECRAHSGRGARGARRSILTLRAVRATTVDVISLISTIVIGFRGQATAGRELSWEMRLFLLQGSSRTCRTILHRKALPLWDRPRSNASFHRELARNCPAPRAWLRIHPCTDTRP